ncbi:cytochrome P450 [Micromonospora sp. HK10]|uniref:cytochrome P450 n=1 Tax=Micromonospora sp. HK10 TaxID=1538294 RepID=UPI001E592A87|nr:cytochrome P450 [Micromonospora sp. HK10]
MSWSIIAPAPGTPPCGPPTPGPDGWIVTRHADVLAVLTDPRCVVPAAAPGAADGTLAWLRGAVSRFSPPEQHAARRAVGVAALADLDPDELRTTAARVTAALLDEVAAAAGSTTAAPHTLAPHTAMLPGSAGADIAVSRHAAMRSGRAGADASTTVPPHAAMLSGRAGADASTTVVPHAAMLSGRAGAGGAGAGVPVAGTGMRSPLTGGAGGEPGAGRVDVMALLARRVPVEVLAAGLGLADPAVAAPAVAAVAAAYHPGADAAAVAAADRAVAALVALSPPAPPEVAANRIGLLVQACDATAGLIGSAVRWGLAAPAAVPTADLLAEVLRLDPPVRATRRVTTGALRLGGRTIGPDIPLLLRFDAANRDPAAHPEPDRFRPGRGSLTFGAGPRGCPGERHALALAEGVVEEVRRRCTATTDGSVAHEPHPTLRVPTRIEVSVR